MLFISSQKKTSWKNLPLSSKSDTFGGQRNEGRSEINLFPPSLLLLQRRRGKSEKKILSFLGRSLSLQFHWENFAWDVREKEEEEEGKRATSGTKRFSFGVGGREEEEKELKQGSKLGVGVF